MWSPAQHLTHVVSFSGTDGAVASLSLPVLALLLTAIVAAAIAGAHCVHARFVRREKAQSSSVATSRTTVLRPKGTLPFVYNTFQAMQHGHRWHDWLVDQAEQFGDRPFCLRTLGGRELVMLTTPQLFEDVLKTHFDAFDKGPYVTSYTRDLLGDGIFGVDGHKWLRQRKTASNLFSLRTLRESMTASIQKHVLVLNRVLLVHATAAAGATSSNAPLDIVELLNRFTMETFAEIGFGVQLHTLDSTDEHPFQTAFDRAQRILKLRFMRPSWFWKTQKLLDVGAEKELRKHIQTIDDTVLGIIGQALEKRKMQATSTGRESSRDIVSLFLDNVSTDTNDADAQTASDDAFNPTFLRDIVVNFLIAGRDTTAQTLSWFFYMLSQHPHVEATIRAELAAKLRPTGSDSFTPPPPPTMEQTNDLVFLEATLRETLRLFPSVPGISKYATCDVTLSDGTFVRKGQSASIPAYVLARMSHVWGDDAKEFKPERWIDATTHKIVHVSPFKFPTFNAGPRLCLGMNLAMTEMKIAAAMVLRQFRLTLAPNQVVTYDLSLTLPIRGKMLMAVEPIGIAVAP